MKNLELLKDKIKQLEPSKSVFNVQEGYRGTELRFSMVTPYNVPETDNKLDELVTYNREEEFNPETNRYEIKKDSVYQKVLRSYRDDLDSIFYKVCPAKKPRQTKFFKVFHEFMRRPGNFTEETHNTIISLVNYYSVNKDEMSNDSTHGKNMYNLLQALVKKYGR